jgi:hypothetical protein
MECGEIVDEIMNDFALGSKEIKQGQIESRYS